MKLTITVPKRIGQALQKAADEFEMTAPDYLKSVLFAAGNMPHGYVLKLDLPPVDRTADPELPLFTENDKHD